MKTNTTKMPSSLYEDIFYSLKQLGINKLSDIKNLPFRLKSYDGHPLSDYAGACIAVGQDSNRYSDEGYNKEVQKCYDLIFQQIKNSIEELSNWTNEQKGFNASIYIPSNSRLYDNLAASATMLLTKPVFLSASWFRDTDMESADPHVFMDLDISIESDFFQMLYTLKPALLNNRTLLLPSNLTEDDYSILSYDSCGDYEDDITREETFAHHYFNKLPGLQYAINAKKYDMNIGEIKDLSNIPIIPIPGFEGLDFQRALYIAEKYSDPLLSFQIALKRLFQRLSYLEESQIINELLKDIDQEYERLNRLYDMEIRSLRNKGYECVISCLILALSLILPDAYSVLVSTVFGTASLKDAIQLYRHEKGLNSRLQTASDFWLPWKLSKTDQES